MSSEKAAEETEAAEEPGAAGPNFVVVGLLRVVDRLLGVLQRVRARLGGPAGEGGMVAPAPAQPPTAVRMVFIFAIALALGIFAGMWFSYDTYGGRLDEQAEQINTQREALVGLEKENARMQRAEAGYKENLAETQKALVETQRSLSKATSWVKNRSDERNTARLASQAAGDATGSVLSPARRSDRGAGPAQTPAPQPKSGTCDINASNPQEGLARCLSEYNR